MDFREVWFQDFVDNRFFVAILPVEERSRSVSVGGFAVQKFRLMDKLTCVQCGAVSYQPAMGKSSRSFMVQCEPECEGNVHGVPSKDVPKTQSEDVSSRRAGKS